MTSNNLKFRYQTPASYFKMDIVMGAGWLSSAMRLRAR